MADDFKKSAELISDGFVVASGTVNILRNLMDEMIQFKAAVGCYWDSEAETFVYSVEEETPIHYRQMYYFAQKEE